MQDSDFARNVEEIFSDDQDIKFRDGDYGQFARVTDISGDDVQGFLDQLDDTPYGTAVTETSEGIGMEVWTNRNV